MTSTSVQRSPAALMRWVGYLVAACAVILDQATKRIAQVELDRGVMVPWLSDAVGWQLTYNDGGAFGLGSQQTYFFLVVTVVVVVIVVKNLPAAPRPAAAAAYGLLLAGAVGNALDRVFRAGDPGDPPFLHGHVVDFVAWGAWPRFNVADVAITVGFALLLLDLLLHERRARAADPEGGPVGDPRHAGQ